MKQVLLFIFACCCLTLKAQDIQKGSVDGIASYTRGAVEFDYSKTTIARSVRSVDELKSSNEDWQKRLPRQEEWCIGSINDDLKGAIVFGKEAKADLFLTLRIDKIDEDIENPVITAIFTDKDGKELLIITDLSDDDLNGIGHILGKFLRRQLRKIR